MIHLKKIHIRVEFVIKNVQSVAILLIKNVLSVITHTIILMVSVELTALMAILKIQINRYVNHVIQMLIVSLAKIIS